MKKKPGAQDLLEKSNPLFGKTTFLEAHPQVTFLDLVVEASPMGFGESRSYHYSLENPPGSFSPCPNPHCKGGGCDIGWFLYDLIAARQTHGETESRRCIGHEPMGRGSSRSCVYMFKAKASLQYKDE